MHEDDNTRSCVYELLCIEAVVVPGAPVVARSLDNRVAADVRAVKIENRKFADGPDDVLVKQRPESCDIPYSESPAALRASSGSRYDWK